jgi:hypothetical protein
MYAEGTPLPYLVTAFRKETQEEPRAASGFVTPLKKDIVPTELFTPEVFWLSFEFNFGLNHPGNEALSE